MVRKADDGGVSTRILVDGQPVAVPVDLSLTGVLDAVRAHAPGRLVIQAEADGVGVPPEHLSTPPGNSPYAREFSFRTADPVLLVRDALLQASDALRDLAPRQKAAAEKLQASETAAGVADLSDVLAVWEQSKQVLQLAQALGVCDGMSNQEDAEALTHLARSLTEVRRTLQTQDWSALSDTLAYDLPPLSARWSVIFANLASNARPVAA